LPKNIPCNDIAHIWDGAEGQKKDNNIEQWTRLLGNKKVSNNYILTSS
jgi:hypothetical protein